jgi:protein tyrosine/serine phosphatase
MIRALLAFSSAALLAATPSFAEPEISGAKQVSAGIFRGGRPNETKFEDLARAGFRTVIDLQGKASAIIPGETPASRLERKSTAESLGLRMINIPTALNNLEDRKDQADILRVAALMNDQKLHPVYVHCAAGRDRTGVAVAAYRILYQGCSYEKARREFGRLGIPLWSAALMAKQMPFLKKLERDQRKITGTVNQRCPL